MEAVADGLPVCTQVVGLRLQEQFLKCGIKLTDGLFLVNSRVALKAFNLGIQSEGDGLGQFGLATSGRAFDQDGLLQGAGDVDMPDGDIIDDVLGRPELRLQLHYRWKHEISCSPHPRFYGNQGISPKKRLNTDAVKRAGTGRCPARPRRNGFLSAEN